MTQKTKSELFNEVQEASRTLENINISLTRNEFPQLNDLDFSLISSHFENIEKELKILNKLISIDKKEN